MNETIIIAFWIGLLGGVHCIGMCGAVVGILTNSLPEKVRKNPKKLASYQLTYNIGRILSYALMGLMFASFSYILSNQIGLSSMEKVLRIFASIMMILIGIFIAGFGNFLAPIEKAGQKIWQKIQPISKKFLPVTSYKNAFLFGFLWGGIPCGLVYSALALTLSVTPIDGFLIMLSFGLGTLPTLLAVSGFGFSLVRFFKKNITQKISGILIISLGIWSFIMPIMHMTQKSEHGNYQNKQHMQENSNHKNMQQIEYIKHNNHIQEIQKN